LIMRIFIIVVFLVFFATALMAQATEPQLIGNIRSDTVATLFGYRIAPLGDQNGDGYDDILTWDYRCSNYVYFGGNPFDTVPVLRIDSVQSRISRVGDINGDLIDDMVFEGRSPDGWKLNAYYGGTLLDSIRDLWFGLDTLFGMGFTVNGGDINSNGSIELFSWSNPQNSVLMFELGAYPDSIPDLVLTPANVPYRGNWYSFGEGLITGYFNGDNYPDLAVSLRYPSQSQINGSIYLYWGGPTFDTIPDLIIRRPGTFQEDYEMFGTVLENLGDVNGDSHDDFFAGRQPSSDSLGFVYFGGPNIDTIPDVVIDENSGKARWAGDLNGDGFNDLITSIYGSLPGLGDVYIYLGGINMDSIPDFELHNWSFPGYHTYFGQDCSGIGDFNGDGANDFAFSAIGADGHGIIYIYSGWKESTDVKYDYEPILPESFLLFQNYPNPFNAETVIKFEVPSKSAVILSVCNIEGREVIRLLDKQVPAGQFSIRWDGRDKSGQSVSSGVYVINLKSDQINKSIKAILMK
jgi:hypothetical protein